MCQMNTDFLEKDNAIYFRQKCSTDSNNTQDYKNTCYVNRREYV